MRMLKYSGRVAVVAGGTRGIGLAVSTRLAQLGLRVASLSRTAGRSSTKTMKSLACDVSNYKAVQSAMTQIEQEWGRIDYLVNCAGILADSPLYLMSEKDWKRVVRTSLDGTFHTSRTLITHMMKQKFGRIVNFVTASLYYSSSGQTNYLSGKGGVAAFTSALAREVGRFGITVNAIAPGFIDTEMLKNIPKDRKSEYISRIPVGRLGKPQEVTDAVLYLLSDNAAYVTGHVLVIDGGWTA